MNKDILMITYFFSENDGVGSIRSRTLNDFLNSQNITTRIIDKDSFGERAKKNILLWSLVLFFRVLFSKEKKIYMSCGPFHPLLFVSLASFIRNKKLIIDFRDAWSLNIKSGYGAGGDTNKIKLFFSETIERISYKSCAHFIVCTLGMEEEYGNLFKDKSKIVTMTNGYDFEPVNNKKDINFKKTNVVCLGKFAEYNFDKAVKTLREVINISQDKETIKLHFIGSEKNINSLALEKVGLREYARFYKRMNYEKAMEIASKCNFGMLIIRDEDLDYGTKIFDYIGLKLYIIGYFNPEKNFMINFRDFIYQDKMILNKEKNERSRLMYKRDNVYKQYINIFK